MLSSGWYSALFSTSQPYGLTVPGVAVVSSKPMIVTVWFCAFTVVDGFM